MLDLLESIIELNITASNIPLMRSSAPLAVRSSISTSPWAIRGCFILLADLETLFETAGRMLIGKN